MDFASRKESAQPIKKIGLAVSYSLQNQLCVAAFRDTGDGFFDLGKDLEGIDLTATLELQAGVQYEPACLQHLCALQIHGFNMCAAIVQTILQWHLYNAIITPNAIS